MKLNFWQWIGVVLLLAGVALLIFNQFREKPDPRTTPTTQPAGR